MSNLYALDQDNQAAKDYNNSDLKLFAPKLVMTIFMSKK